MKFLPAGDKVLVEIDPDDLPEYDDDDDDNPSLESKMVAAKVIGIGPDYGKKPGKDEPCRAGGYPKLSVGSTVHVRCHGGDIFEQDGKHLKYVDAYDIMGVLAGGPATKMSSMMKSELKRAKDDDHDYDKGEEMGMED